MIPNYDQDWADTLTKKNAWPMAAFMLKVFTKLTPREAEIALAAFQAGAHAAVTEIFGDDATA